MAINGAGRLRSTIWPAALALTLLICPLADAYEANNVRQYEQSFSITVERVERAPEIIAGLNTVVWYKVTNNSDKDFDGVDFICTIFKKDGAFLHALQHGTFNVKHGHSEYVEEDIMDLDPRDFGKADCRLIMLTTN